MTLALTKLNKQQISDKEINLWETPKDMFQKIIKNDIICPSYDKYISNILRRQCKLNAFIINNNTLPKSSTTW